MTIELMPWVLLGVKGLLVVAATVFFVSGLDDFFIDVYHAVRRLYRRFFVMPKYQGLTEKHLLLPAEKPIAVMIPAWDESAVIGRMLEHTLTTLNYANYTLFVGTYPNDTDTQREVERVRERYDNVHRIVCPNNGPTSKADCLNWIYQGIRVFEQEKGVEFQVFVMHDSEDLLHPLSLKLFNYLIPRKDMVQLPVLPLEPKWHQLTAGHYLDEFAENHSKDLVVRERLSRVVPSAGVGCGFSRRAFETVARDNDNQLFNVDSVTEDYDFGFRLRRYGLKEIFVKHAIERTTMKKSRWTGKSREVKVKEYIATREYFPRTVRSAIRQKARWVVGIALQGWVSLGWKGDGWVKYMLLRDRKALVTNLVNVLGYVVVLSLFALWLAPRVYADAYRYPPLVERGSWLWFFILGATFFLGLRLAARAFYVQRLYGTAQALLSVPRQLWANFINFGAVTRALYLFSRHLLKGEAIGWDKTAHRFPSESELKAFRRQLGDLLLERRFVTLADLDRALARQEEVKRPLGAVLVELGLVEEDSLVQVLGSQLQLSTRRIDPYAVDADLLRILPRELAIRHSVFPLELADGGRLRVATDRALERSQVEEIERTVERPVELCLSTRSDLAFAIRRGYERLEQAGGPATSPLGKALVDRGLISAEQLEEALRAQRRSYSRLGEILQRRGLLTGEALSRAIQEHALESSGRFGDFLVRHGYLLLAQLEEALEDQRSHFRRLGDVIVDLGFVSRETLQLVLKESLA